MAEKLSVNNEIVELVRNNRWFAKINGDLKISENQIVGFMFESDKNELIMEVQDDESLPIFEIDKKYNYYSEQEISISFIDCTGKVLYTQEYSGCKIKSYNHGGIYYKDDSPHIIFVTFTYKSRKLL